MNENINLCEILKGHEGETFYSPLYGSLELIKVDSENYAYPIYFKAKVVDTVNFDKQGKPNGLATEYLVFPSKDQRDWNKWDKENNKTSKTWSKLCKQDNRQVCRGECIGVSTFQITTYCPTSILKSALALLKIHQLIEVSYGGNVSRKCWQNKVTYTITPEDIYTKDITSNPESNIGPIFHTKEQAKEFLSYEENIQLLKDYYQIVEYKPGDEVIIDGVKLRVEYAETDGSGCYACDCQKGKCYFLDKKNVPCPDCETGRRGGPFGEPNGKVVFIKDE